ncbi:DUF4157 domain-containing protein [Streptomyces subrutilus]
MQLLRQAGHPWAQEQHQHSAGCGHQQNTQAEQAPVQRSAVHEVLRAPGRPLDDATRSDMETRLGADFSGVRVHDDSVARASAAEVGARAYTSGHHVVIGEGGADKHTLAHELTHVIQQRQGPVAGTDNGRGLSVSDPGDRFEREAEANATRVMRSESPISQQTAAPADSQGGPAEGAIQRQVSLRDPQNPQNTRELRDEQSVRDFLEQYNVSILQAINTLIFNMADSVSTTQAGRVGFKVSSIIQSFVKDDSNRIYEDSAAGAKRLGDEICSAAIQSLAAGYAPSAPSGPAAMLEQMKQRQPSGGNTGPDAPSGVNRHLFTDALSKFTREVVDKNTPDSPALAGLGMGVESAINNRINVIKNPSLPDPGYTMQGMLWAAYFAINGEDKIDQAVDSVTSKMSPNEGQDFRDTYSTTKTDAKEGAAGFAAGSAVVGGALSTAGKFIPNPVLKGAFTTASGATSVLATAKTLGDVGQAMEELEKVNPEAFQAFKRERDQGLKKVAEDISNSASTMVGKQRENIGDQFS